jgi:hypothetical protein
MTGQNPTLDATFDRGMQKAGQAIDSHFAQAGRYGSGAQAGALSDAATNLATQIYGGDYENAANRQLQAAGTIGQMSTADQQARIAALQGAGTLGLGGQNSQIAALQGAGGLQTDATGNVLRASAIAPTIANTDYTNLQAAATLPQFQQTYAQQLASQPAANLAGYQGAVTGNFGGTQTQTQPYYSNTGANVIGGGLGLASIGNSLFGQNGIWPNFNFG